MFYEVTVTRSDASGNRWIANDMRILRRSRDIAYQEGWWLQSVERTGSMFRMQFVAVDDATMEQQVRFVNPYRIRVKW